LKLTKLCLAVSALSVAMTATSAEFITGADLSHLAYLESKSVVYKDSGVTQDALVLMKNKGLTCARLRLFTSSAAQAAADPYDYINNLDYTVPLAVRVKNAGLKFLLDFHYSDTWADPGNQAKPSAWTNLTFVQLEQQMRVYNSNSIAAFRDAGAMPDYVQIGNEIIGGMVWPDGQVSGSYNTSWSNLGRLMKAAINGIKDAAGTNAPKIMIHIDRGGDWSSTQWYFDNVQYQQVPFDMIGESYYPWWHGDFTALSNCVNNAASRYGKPVVVVETAFPWSNSTNIYGIPATTNGQVQFVTELAKIVKGVPGGKGAGIFWWGTEFQHVNGVNMAGFDRKSFFGSGTGSPVPTGEVLPVAEVYGQLSAPLTLSAGVSNGTLNLTWPLSGAGMLLTSVTDLSLASAWLPVTNAIQSTGAVFSATVPVASDNNRFYRLQSH
jgi:arabinogalactan endo-1,4-beta-galactosidase